MDQKRPEESVDLDTRPWVTMVFCGGGVERRRVGNGDGRRAWALGAPPAPDSYAQAMRRGERGGVWRTRALDATPYAAAVTRRL